MTDLREAFPPFGLRVEAGPLVLRPITDEVLPRLIDVALAGVHKPDEAPFYHPWTDAPADKLPTDFVRYHWSTRSGWSREQWALDLAVEYEGLIVGAQGVTTTDFLATRSGETGSWLGLEYHGKGIGTRMRQAICALCFDHLGFEELTSGAFDDNPASNAVSRKVGYQPNGVARLARKGTWAANYKYVLTPETFVRGEPVTVTGAEAFRKFVGLEDR